MMIFIKHGWFFLLRKLTKAKGPVPAGPVEQRRGLALFTEKPPTPKMLRAFGDFRKGGFLEKIKVPPVQLIAFWITVVVNS